jgi:peptide/nickel transport system substrate-binding protein
MSPRLNVITVVAIASACTPRERRTPDDTLVMAIESPVLNADPRYTISNYDATVSRLVAPGLFAMDTPTMEPRFDLATAIERVDDVTWDVTLRPDAKFSDGEAVRAEDVVGTFRSVYEEHSDSLWHKGMVERYASVEAVGPLQVRFHLQAPLATLRSDLEFGIVSFHHGGAKLPDGRVVGAGPYLLRELTSTAAYLDANPYYFGPKPAIPHVEIRFVRDAAARILMLVGGSLDLIQNGVRLDLVDEIAERPRVRVETAPSVILSYLMMNNDDPVLEDVRVRRAIAYALDRPAIIDAKYEGRAVLATGLLPPSHWAYTGDVATYPHDAARARQLLAEAGHPHLHLVYKTSSDAFRVSVARVIASQLGEVGIDVEVRSFEFATFFADIKKGNFQLASMQTTPITGPDYYYAYFNSTRIPTATDPDANNRWRYRNADVDRWTYEGRHELDLGKQKAIYANVQRRLAEDVPIVPLWHEDNVVLSNSSIRGYRIIPTARLNGLLSVDRRVSPP